MIDVFVCFGTADECPECGGAKPPGIPYCTPECEGAARERWDALDAARQRRRAQDDAFAVAAADLRALGYTDPQIDAALSGMA